MRNKVLASMLLAFLPWLAMAQSNDDLYFIPKKESKVENTDKVGVVPKEVSNKTVSELPENITPVVVKDVKGNVRDVDEYNRRYTSRDNNFSYQNDTLYIEEKPYGERGEWVNGFQGSQMDYEYAMRIVRFRNPRYAIPVSSPLYWDAVYGAFPSWDWNVYDDGLYAYVFPTYTNRLWWDWRWSSGFYGPGWGWYSPYYYSSWYSPYWYGGYWGFGGHWGFGSYWGFGGYWGGYWGPGWHHHPYYGWGGGWRNPVHYSYNNRRAEFGMPGRGTGSNRFTSSSSAGVNRNNTLVRTVDNNGRTGGRVVTSSRNSSTSVRTQTGVRGTTSGSGVYTRPSRLGERDNTSTYNRPSSTRVNTSNRYNGVNSNRYNNNSNRYNNNSNVNRVTTTRSFGGSSYRSTTTSGGSSRSVGTSTGGGGARRR